MRPVPTSLRRFLRDDRAAVTVEFALWLPMIFVLLAGAVLFFDLFRVSSKAVKATDMLGDIVSRQTVVDDAFLGTLLPLFQASVADGVAERWVRITSVRRLAEEDAGGVVAPDGEGGEEEAPRYAVLWSHADGGGAPLTLADLPEAMMPEMAGGDTVILTETVLRHNPIGGRILGVPPVTYRNMTVSRPRFVPAVVRD